MTQENELDIKSLGVYLIEGVAEVDPITDRVYVRTVDQQGNPIEFDPVPVLRKLKGQEVRVVVIPLSSVAQLEELARKIDAAGTSVESVTPETEPKAN